MTYATEIIHHYRMALRSVWNSYFWPRQYERNLDLLKDFNELKLPFFVSLVSKRLGRETKAPTELFGKQYLIVPKVLQPGSTIQNLLVDVSPGGALEPRWEPLHASFRKDEICLTLLDLCDIQDLEWKDFRYFKVRIESIAGYPEMEGRLALIDVLAPDVLWDPSEIIGLPIFQTPGPQVTP